MFVQQKSTTLPPPKEIAVVTAEARQKQFALTDKMFDAFLTPDYTREELVKAWTKELSREHGGKKPYRVIHFVHMSRLGEVYLEAAIRGDHTELYLGVGDPHGGDETGEDGEPAFVRVNSTDMKLDPETDSWLKKVWHRFQPVAPLQSVKKTQPNQPCPCNSGKKYKKCVCVEYH